jgi:hypothetical protein
MTTMADMALERGWFVDQSQSFSAFMKEPNLRQLSNYIRYGFKIGLKTIIYYLRVRPAADADNIMVDAYDKRKEKQDNLKRSRSVESTELAVDISTADSSEDQLVDSNSSDDNLSHKSKKSKKDSNNNSNNEETIEVTNPLLSSPDTALVGIDPVKPNAPSKRRREALASRAAPRRKLDFESSMQDKRKDDNNDDDDDNQSNSCSLTRGCIPCGT